MRNNCVYSREITLLRVISRIETYRQTDRRTDGWANPVLRSIRTAVQYSRTKIQSFRILRTIYCLALNVCYLLYTVSGKNVPPNLCPYIRQILTNFDFFLTDTLTRKFAITRLLNILPQLSCVATLPCEI